MNQGKWREGVKENVGHPGPMDWLGLTGSTTGNNGTSPVRRKDPPLPRRRPPKYSRPPPDGVSTPGQQCLTGEEICHLISLSRNVHCTQTGKVGRRPNQQLT
ncbi:hypothetical protein WMY93_007515 [Mugilogobius chulae]|uniref:Uncharacterized protein n=1 Tax=Mugilogobius chulae TaxID=88201 RepID=A0AAW0PNV3_9GOBI